MANDKLQHQNNKQCALMEAKGWQLLVCEKTDKTLLYANSLAASEY